MTKLTDHVVSLELAIQLKEAGLPQKSIFYWCDDAEGNWDVCLWEEANYEYGHGISAYTASELISNIQIAYAITFFGNTQHTIRFRDSFYTYIPSEVNLANSIAILALKAITEYNLKPFYKLENNLMELPE